jgi:hypothetical protein
LNLLKQILFGLCILILVSITAIGTAALKARSSDGPTHLFPGGPLTSGPLISGPEPDWRFTDQIESIELQLFDPRTSRRVWVTQYDGKIYVISSGSDTFLARLWFTWPLRAAEDGRAIVRIDGKRHRRQLRRIRSGQELDGITAALREKYSEYDAAWNRQDVEDGVLWLFELAPQIEGS